ncbi:uncharacterized protein [Parasteatoda tepidariorum]|uniref:uncharacterized protein n=1 Tax=Parasteatoda tepidariorum TaxID=114398 RepID=UPI001C71A0D4|nr:uncharacterized protein LOC122269318 [Parasteatoda tepidariorum]
MPRKIYKQYLEPDSDVSVPRNTLHRRKIALKESLGTLSLGQEVSRSDTLRKQKVQEGPSLLPESSRNTEEFLDQREMIDECFFSEDPNSDDDNEEQIPSVFDDSDSIFESSCNFNQKFLEMIESKVKISKGELIVMILNFALRHHLSDVGVNDLLEMFNVILGNKLPKTSSTLYNVIGTKSINSMNHHFFCHVCFKYVSTLSTDEKTVQCHVCNVAVNTSNPQRNNSFISVDLKSQLTEIVENNDALKAKLSSEPTIRDSEIFEDIVDGRLYKKLQDDHSGQHILTYNFSLDGMAMHNNSKGSAWPIFVSLNELPLKERNNHVMLAGLWFGKKEPKFEVFLKPFTEMASDLAINGLNVHLADKNINVKVIPACCCSDSVARPCLQNSIQFNGFYGCSWCLHPGFNVDGTIKYSIRNDVIFFEDRNEEETAKLATEAIKSGRYQLGIKGRSPLAVIPHFNVVQGFSPDTMHSVFLGVCKRIVSLWLDTTNKDKDYYIGNPKCIKAMNAKLSNVVMPQCVGRVPRLMFERKLYKANEWRNFLLYVCIPVVRDVLPTEYVDHISHLIGSMFLLLQESINVQDLQKVDEHLIKFVAGVQYLYGESAMTFNVHSLLHLTKSVLDWGPLWIRSMFLYEGANGILRKFSTGPTGIASQMARRYLLNNELKSKQMLKKCCPEVVQYVAQLNSNCKNGIGVNVGNVVLFGFCKKPEICSEYEYSLHNAGEFSFYSKFLMNNQVFSIKKSERIIYTDDNSMGYIEAIAANADAKQIYVYFYKLDNLTLLHENIASSFFTDGKGTRTILHVDNICGKCCEIYTGENFILTKVVHNFECIT